MCRKRFDSTIDMALHAPELLPTIMGGAAQLQQVFLNLCLNANDALEGVAEQFIRVVASSPNGAESSPDQGITIRVSDNGVGMEDEVQIQAFAPFFTTKEVNKGTGLGLATAFGIVQNHDGSIECESTAGVGTTFTVHLPTAESDTVPEPEKVVEEIPRGTETLLVIDDEEVIRKSLSAYLSGQGVSDSAGQGRPGRPERVRAA